MSNYAWIIDRDHLADDGDEPGTNMNAVGVIGPRDAPDALCELLQSTGTVSVLTRAGYAAYQFRMYDDDGELYYTGRLITDGDPEDEDVCGGPLYDYGQPNAGAVSIAYKGNPSMDCG